MRFQSASGMTARLLSGGTVAAVIVWSSTSATADERGFRYSGLDLPEEAVPRWALVQKGGEAEPSDGKLRAEVAAGERRLYAIGTLRPSGDRGEVVWGEADAWTFQPGGDVKLELRMRCEAEDPAMEVFRLIIRDGSRQWALAFSSSTLGRTPIDATQWDTYTITITGGLMSVISERQGQLLERNGGTPDERSHALMFGSYFYTKDNSPVPRIWEVEFLRWSASR